jgi:hypothetical protein
MNKFPTPCVHTLWRVSNPRSSVPKAKTIATSLFPPALFYFLCFLCFLFSLFSLYYLFSVFYFIYFLFSASLFSPQGNYLGAVKGWVDTVRQSSEPAESNLFAVVDLHAITLPQNPGNRCALMAIINFTPDPRGELGP